MKTIFGPGGPPIPLARTPPAGPLAATAFPLLLAPAESLLVLDFFGAHPHESARHGAAALKVGINTFYRAVERLEDLGLIAVDRAPGGKRTRATHVTPRGREVLKAIGAIPAAVAESRAALELEMRARPPLPGSVRAGEILCRLAEDAQRRGAIPELRRLEREALRWKREGEAAMAGGMVAFLTNRHNDAVLRLTKSLEVLQPEGNSRSLRKALAVLGAAYEYAGQPRPAMTAVLELRKLSRQAGDLAMEADASQSLGFLKARRDHIADAQRDYRRALDCAQRGALMDMKPRILSNLCLVEFLLAPETGLSAAEEALQVAREAGARIAIARVQTNRALMLAWKGDEVASRRAMREARRLLAQGGEEKGLAALELWAKMVKRVLGSPAKLTASELRRAVQEYLQVAAPPSPLPGAVPRAQVK